MEEIAANREAVIEEIFAMWLMDEPGGEEQFRSTLDLAHESQLLAILRAESYDEVKAILGDGMETLGDTDKDLVFAPVNPCWAVDTRRGGGGFIPAGTIRNYNVHGNLATQGGSNCPAPRGEPRAVLLNVIAVNPNGKGNLNVVPFGVDPRNQGALSVNFNVTAGTNLANTGIIKTAYLSTADISLSANFSGCHAVIIVMGYYYDVDEDDFKVRIAFGEGPGTTELKVSDGCKAHGFVGINVPDPGKIMITGQAILRLKSHTMGTSDRMQVYIGSSSTDCPDFPILSQGFARMIWEIHTGEPSWSGGNKTIPVHVSRTFTVNSSGSRTYWLNGKRNSGNGVAYLDGGIMQAVYYPDR